MKVVAVGDCGIDRYIDVKADRPGGISLNFAVNARFWFPGEDEVGVLTVLGDDREAGIVAAAVTREGLDATIARRAGATPVQYINRDAGGERHFVRYEAGVLARHRLGAEERRVIAASDVMMATVFTQIVDFFETVVAAPSAGTRALDYCNLGPPDDPLAYVRRYTSHFDVGFASIEVGDGALALVDALEAIARREGRLIVVTLGRAGAIALSSRGRVVCPALPVPVDEVVDTTGAGDAFAAGFLSTYVRGGGVEASLARGAKAAAQTVIHIGAFPAELEPWPADAPAAWTAPAQDGRATTGRS